MANRGANVGARTVGAFAPRLVEPVKRAKPTPQAICRPGDSRVFAVSDLSTAWSHVELGKDLPIWVALGKFSGVEFSHDRTTALPLMHGSVIPVGKDYGLHLRQNTNAGGAPSGAIYIAGFADELAAREAAKQLGAGDPPSKTDAPSLSVTAAADPGGAAAAGEQIAFSAAARQVRVVAHGTNTTPLWIAETQAKAAGLAAPAIPIEAAGVFTWFTRSGALWVASAAGAELYSWVEDRE